MSAISVSVIVACLENGLGHVQNELNGCKKYTQWAQIHAHGEGDGTAAKKEKSISGGPQKYECKVNTALTLSIIFFFSLYLQNKKAEDGEEDEEEVLDEETKKKDQIIKGAIDGLIREYATELNAPSQDEDSQRRKRKKEKKEEVF